MRARVGDRLIIKGHNVGDPDRDAEVIATKGKDGSPPWVVRWEETGHEVLLFPGPDALVQHFPAHRAARATPIGRRAVETVRASGLGG